MTDPEQLKSALRDHAMNVAVRYKNDWTYLDAINERESWFTITTLAGYNFII
jgi:GH35 family endo-1,4-beta-xylanase